MSSLIPGTVGMGRDERIIYVADLRINQGHRTVSCWPYRQTQPDLFEFGSSFIDLNRHIAAQESCSQREASDSTAYYCDGKLFFG